MFKIAVCDDEIQTLEEILLHIKEYEEKKNENRLEIFCFESAKALINAIEDGNVYDIFLLDVYIGNEMGTELAKSIRRKGIENPIIFITNAIEHAPESFELGTLRYLIKPIDLKKLYEAMDAALLQAEKLGERMIKLKTESGMECINANHIIFSEAHGHYQYIMLESGKQLRVRMTVTELYFLFMKCGGFVRVGSAYIINLRNIKNVSTSEVHMYNNIHVPIPRGKHTEIKKAFWDFQCEG